MAEGTFLATWARHGDGEGGLVVKALELGTHCTGVTGGLLPSPCLTQFPAGLGQGGQRSASTSGLGLLRFSGIACSREGFLSCRLPISGPGNRLSSHGRKPLLLVKRYSWQILMMWKMGSHRVPEPRRGEMVDEKRQQRVKS